MFPYGGKKSIDIKNALPRHATSMLNSLGVSKKREIQSFIAVFGFLFDYKKT